VRETITRDGLFAAQTPQGFVLSEITAAHEQASEANRVDFTDDTSLAEWAGLKTRIVEGSPSNIKITTKADLVRANGNTAMQKMPDIRTGHGYDTHRFVAGDKVRLCGLDIAHTAKLDGHSDADVGLHALTDALLATIAEGDIGSHFPPSDAKWKGADSEVFFKHAVNLVSKRGGTLTHLDVTLICEAPKIGPHREAMRERLAEMAGIESGRVSVKATTNETMGFIGRAEGMVAYATATAFFGYVELSK